MLDDFAAPSKDGARFPAAWVVAFCEVTGDDSLQRFLLGPRLSRLIEIGELEISSRRNRAAKESALRDLSGKDDGDRR
jgi:hypothetical protein